MDKTREVSPCMSTVTQLENCSGIYPSQMKITDFPDAQGRIEL